MKLKDLTFRWVDGYYDGILSGFAIWRGRLCYFEIGDDTTNDRKFTLHSLSDNEAEDAIRLYEAFKALHGDHNDLLPDGSYTRGTCRTRTTLEELAAIGDAIAAEMEAGVWKPPVSYRLNPDAAKQKLSWHEDASVVAALSHRHGMACVVLCCVALQGEPGGSKEDKPEVKRASASENHRTRHTKCSAP